MCAKWEEEEEREEEGTVQTTGFSMNRVGG
jgi:hypothetical protein